LYKLPERIVKNQRMDYPPTSLTTLLSPGFKLTIYCEQLLMNFVLEV